MPQNNGGTRFEPRRRSRVPDYRLDRIAYRHARPTDWPGSTRVRLRVGDAVGPKSGLRVYRHKWKGSSTGRCHLSAASILQGLIESVQLVPEVAESDLFCPQLLLSVNFSRLMLLFFTF